PKFDIHHRFKAEESLAFKHNFLQIPLVDIWAIELGKIIQDKYTKINFELSEYHEIHSFDVDFAYKYRGLNKYRFFIKALGNILRLNFKELIKMFDKTLVDEFDTYDFIIENLQKQKASSIFFFLVAEKSSQHDKNLLPTSPEYKQLINQISSKFEFGIHPSYHASALKKLLQNEQIILNKIINKPIDKNRFHFLKFKLPSSYNYLIETNILKDYSMAYANKIGFRASTCKDFYFYDLVENKPTLLEVFSPCIMDVTLKNFELFTPKEATIAIKKMKNSVKNVKGTFISIWHNSNLTETAEWKDWKTVWGEMIEVKNN
ncbi:MAG: polysaccharide deacetylase family protein, partial [Bacteroidia bacterium]